MPYIEEQLYLPFLSAWAQHPFANPWHSASELGVLPYAFPYGLAQAACFYPASLFIHFGLHPHIAYGLTLAAFSHALSFLFWRNGKSARTSLLLGFANPAIVLSAVLFGANDCVAILALLISYLRLGNNDYKGAGFWLLAAASCKLSLILAFPFFLVYCLKSDLGLLEKKNLLYGLLGGAALFLLMPAEGWNAVFSNPETVKTLSLALPFGFGSRMLLVPILPLIWLLWLYSLWNRSFLTFKLYCAMSAGGLFLTSLLTPGNFGWLLWSLPGFALCGVREKNRIKTYTLFAFFVLAALAESAIVMRPAGTTELGRALGFPQFSELFPDWLFSTYAYGLAKALSLAIGAVILLRYRKLSLLANDPFCLESKSALVLIAGDSGSGKDTLSEALRKSFPVPFSTAISGDDYHQWDRGNGMWQSLTHLNPFANDLSSFSDDTLKLRNGFPVRNRHYNHESGVKGDLMTLTPSPLIVSSGLHALYMDQLNSAADLKIFLDTDEALRIKLKIERDTAARGHSPEKILQSIQKRDPDAQKYIRPQIANADIVFRMRPANPSTLSGRAAKDVKLALEARSKLFGNEYELRKVLCGVCGLQLEIERSSDSTVSLYLEGEFSSEDAMFAASLLCPGMSEHFEKNSEHWPTGLTALIQVLSLMALEIQLRKRSQ